MNYACNCPVLPNGVQHNNSCQFFRSAAAEPVPNYKRPTLWLHPCYECQAKDAEIARLKRVLALEAPPAPIMAEKYRDMLAEAERDPDYWKGGARSGARGRLLPPVPVPAGAAISEEAAIWSMLGNAGLRCHVTGNPVGTDTWAAGSVCPCPACHAALLVVSNLRPAPEKESR